MKNKRWSTTRTTPENIEDRFWSKVIKSNKSNGCWNWIGFTIKKSGHGQFQTLHGLDYAHRFSWELHYGKIPDGLFVLHKCDNGRCIRPDHLFLGTQLDNMRDASQKGRMKNHPIETRAFGKRNGKYTHPEKTPRGEKHGNSKLTQVQVEEIRAKYIPNKYSYKKLAKEYNVHWDTIRKIIKNTLWK